MKKSELKQIIREVIEEVSKNSPLSLGGIPVGVSLSGHQNRLIAFIQYQGPRTLQNNSFYKDQADKVVAELKRKFPGVSPKVTEMTEWMPDSKTPTGKKVYDISLEHNDVYSIFQNVFRT